MEILVFKTDIRFKKQLNQVKPHLGNIDGILRWNIDLQDRDKILRIESHNLSPRMIEERLQKAGYYCCELEG